MAERQIPRHALDLSTQDFLSLLNTPPGENGPSPTTPTQQYMSTPRSHSAGRTPHKPRAGSHPRAIAPFAHMAPSLSVSFPINPVSDTRVFSNGSPFHSEKSEPVTPESSPFSPEAYYKSPEDERRGPSPFLSQARLESSGRTKGSDTKQANERDQHGAVSTPSPSRRGTTGPTPSTLHTSPEKSSILGEQQKTIQVDRTISKPPILNTNTKQPLFPPRELLPEHCKSHELSVFPQTKTNTQLSTKTIAPPPSSTDVPLLQTPHDNFQDMEWPTKAATTRTAAPRRKSGLFNRVKHAAAKKVHAVTGSNVPSQPISNNKSTTTDQNTTHDMDLEALFYLVEGRITFDREIKGLFEENDGLKRIWKEATPLFQKGDEDGFAGCIERLENAMTALSGRTIAFV